MCQNWTILYDTVGFRVCQLCLSSKLNLLQKLIFQVFANSCEMFPWMARGYQSASLDHYSTEVPDNYREAIHSNQQPQSSRLHTVYDVGNFSQMRQYPFSSTVEYSNQLRCHASDSPVIHAHTERHRPQQIHSYITPNIGSRFLTSSVSPLTVSEQIRSPQTAGQQVQESVNRSSPVNSNFSFSADVSPMPTVPSHTSATRNSNTVQVFNYNHCHQEEETLKEQIRANILQQIYPSPLHHPGRRGSPSLHPHQIHSHSLELNDLERCRDYNSELNSQADTHLREGSSSTIDYTPELRPPLGRFRQTGDVSASLPPHYLASPEDSTPDSRENDFILASHRQMFSAKTGSK